MFIYLYKQSLINTTIMTQMQKEIERLIAEGTEFKVDKDPYGGWYVKYRTEKPDGFKYTFWASYTEDGKYIHPICHVNAI